MMIHKILISKYVAPFFVLAFLSSPAKAVLLDLEDPVLPYALQYGDFYSYSLPVYNDSVDGTALGDNTKIQPGEAGYIDSQPGELSKPGEYIVIATGTNNAGVYDNSDAATFADNAYETYEGANESFTTDKTSNPYGLHTSADPGGAGEFTGDLADSWDIDIVDLLKFLENDEGTGLDALGVFFNHNETGGAQSLFAWADVWITDANGGLFEFTGEKYDGTAGDNHLILESPLAGALDPFTPEIIGTGTEWVFAAGAVCLNGDNLTDPPDPTCSIYANPIEYNHNLGADNAAYVVISEILDTALDGLFVDYKNGLLDYGQLILHADISMWDEDNGFEQIFIGAIQGEDPSEVPSPGPIGLIAIGLLSIVFIQQARRKEQTS